MKQKLKSYENKLQNNLYCLAVILDSRLNIQYFKDPLNTDF